VAREAAKAEQALTSPKELTAEELDELAELERAATPGEWHREYLELSTGGPMTLGVGSAARAVCIVSGLLESPQGLRDVAFLVAARNALPALIHQARLYLETKEKARALEYGIERRARQELWSFIRLHAGKSGLQAASVEWLDAFAPELVSGRFADVPNGGEGE
jgi:hypothetical protein